MANDNGPYVCLHAGCQRHEAYLHAIQTHIVRDHDIERSLQKRGVDFGSEEEALQLYAYRQEKADREGDLFAKQLASLAGVDDFLFEAGDAPAA